MIAKLLLALLGLSIAAGVGQTVRLSSARADLTALRESITTAQAKSETRAATTGLEAVTNYVQVQEQDAPVVERAVDRIRNVCLQQPTKDRLPVSAASGVPGQAGREAEDGRARAQYVDELAADLKTCAAELNRLDAIRTFHNHNVGEAR